jgi:hypothetical protein
LVFSNKVHLVGDETLTPASVFRTLENSTLKMETAHSFEMTVYIYQTMPGEKADTKGKHEKSRTISLKA